MRTAPMLLATLFAAIPADAAPTAQAYTPLRAVAESAPAIMISKHTANRMKQELDGYALFVDVDAPANAAPTVPTDAQIPLHVYNAPETFDEAFVARVDDALRAKRLRFDDGVVVVSSSARTALQAAELMREHGYTLVFAVTTP